MRASRKILNLLSPLLIIRFVSSMESPFHVSTRWPFRSRSNRIESNRPPTFQQLKIIRNPSESVSINRLQRQPKLQSKSGCLQTIDWCDWLEKGEGGKKEKRKETWERACGEGEQYSSKKCRDEEAYSTSGMDTRRTRPIRRNPGGEAAQLVGRMGLSRCRPGFRIRVACPVSPCFNSLSTSLSSAHNASNEYSKFHSPPSFFLSSKFIIFFEISNSSVASTKRFFR